MSATLLADVQNQVQAFWSPTFTDQLKENTLLPSLVNKQYQGYIKAAGDRVRVNQVNRPTAERKTVGAGHETFSTQTLSTSYVDIIADQVITAAYEFDDLVQLQSQIGQQDSKIRQGLMEAVEIELNKYLYTKVAPSVSNPAHRVSGVADFNASALNNVRKLASQAKWAKDGGWWLLSDPSYMTDLLNAQTLTSSDYTGGEAPVIGGQMARQRFGFNILEDNSMSASVKPSFVTGAEDMALAFHPDFLHLVMQTMPEIKVSDLHSNKQFGYVISIRLIVGSSIGIDGAKKHIVVYNA